MCPPTRLRILDYLRKQQTASVHELSSALAMTGANVRHHLSVLESNDLIELISQRREGRGRPVTFMACHGGYWAMVWMDWQGQCLRFYYRNAPEAEREAGLRSVALRLGGNDMTKPRYSAPSSINTGG